PEGRGVAEPGGGGGRGPDRRRRTVDDGDPNPDPPVHRTLPAGAGAVCLRGREAPQGDRSGAANSGAPLGSPRRPNGRASHAPPPNSPTHPRAFRCPSRVAG